MGKLEDLEKELYGKGEEEIRRRMRRRVYFPRSLQKLSSVWREPLKRPQEKIGLNWPMLKLLLGAAGIIFIILGATFLFLYLGTRGQEAELEIRDRGQISAGELITIPFVFRNISQTALKEVELTIVLPPGSVLYDNSEEQPAPARLIKKIQDLNPGESGTVEITARLFGQEGEGKEIEGTLLYRPENLRARFSSKASKIFTVGIVPLALSWEVPELLSQGQEVEAKVRYTSNAAQPFQDLWVRFEYPPGFEFMAGNPAPEVDKQIWKIGALEPNKEGNIILKGKISGEEGELKSFRSELGVYNPLTKEWKTFREATAVSKIAITPLSVQAFLNNARQGVISPGDQLNFTLRYKNNTEAVLRGVSLQAFLEGEILDTASLSLRDGVFDFTTRSLLWGPGTVSELRELQPGQSGELNFTIKAKNIPVMRSDKDKNQTVRLRAEIKAGVTPAGFSGTDISSRDILEFKVRTKVAFSGKVLFRSSPIPNAGALPPRVGAKTQYVILWEVRNFTNDVQNLEAVAILPPNVKWTDAFLPQNSRVVFDQGSAEVRWSVGDIKAGTGIISPAVTLAFQVEVTPSENDVGKPMVLAAESRLKGKDVFVGEEISQILPPFTTELSGDPAVKREEWLVVK